VLGTRNSPKQAFGRKERHLSIVSDRSHFAEGFRVILDTFRSVAFSDFGQGVKFDSPAKGVADRSAQEAAQIMVQSSPGMLRMVGMNVLLLLQGFNRSGASLPDLFNRLVRFQSEIDQYSGRQKTGSS
jgi:hypothetical protein